MGPPFGGKCDLIGRTLAYIKKEFRAKGCQSVDFVWIFPYFMEPQIVQTQLGFKMSDYQVRYQREAKYKDGTGKGRSAGSPVRIFTTIPLTLIDLSKVEGYKHCAKCETWVCHTNKHCKKCGVCTSKNGAPYRHCDKCGRCVKVSWEHCPKCQRCCLIQSHPCEKFRNSKKHSSK